jgi:hypothetical protein
VRRVWIALSLLSVLAIGILGVARFVRWYSRTRPGVRGIAYACLGCGLPRLALFVFAGVPVALFLAYATAV